MLPVRLAERTLLPIPFWYTNSEEDENAQVGDEEFDRRRRHHLGADAQRVPHRPGRAEDLDVRHPPHVEVVREYVPEKDSSIYLSAYERWKSVLNKSL